MEFAVQPPQSTSSFSALLATAIQKITWSGNLRVSLHHGAMGAQQEELQAFYKTLTGQQEKETRKKRGEIGRLREK